MATYNMGANNWVLRVSSGRTVDNGDYKAKFTLGLAQKGPDWVWNGNTLGGITADPLLANVANLLVQYAGFCGTGMKTRLGMGHTLGNI